jgi:glycosyltransferase involved in cell wall biosynthesis
MSAPVVHLLTETDSFSDLHGAALQRWVANVLRFEQEPSLVACPRSDDSWGLDRVKALLLPGQRAYSLLRGRYRLPWAVRRPMLRWLLRPVVERLGPGSVLWIHNRPDYAAAIQDDVQRTGAKLVVHLHNSLMISFPAEITRSLRADRLVFCSGYLEREAKSAFPALNNTNVIYNGADAARFFPRAPGVQRAGKTPTVLFAGRLVPEKGAHVFVEAMRILRSRGVSAQGRLLGATGFGSQNRPTSYSSKVMRNAPSNVHFGGYCAGASLADEFRAADVFCSPSVWPEPFGLVNVEAMASGLPTVTTNGGGVPEVFASGGAVLVARDSPTELAEALELVVRDSAFRQRLAAEAFQSFQQNFTWQAAHARYREVLSALNHA